MHLSEIFKTLSDDTRIRILNILKETELCVCEVQAILEIPQTNASKHLNKLKSNGIITYKKKAQWAYYYLDPTFLENHNELYQYLCKQFAAKETYLNDVKSLKEYQSKDINCI